MRAFIDFPDSAAPPDADLAAARWQARFENPLQVLTAWQPEAVPALLQQVHAHARALFLDALDREPQAHVFYDTHVPWVAAHDALPRQSGES